MNEPIEPRPWERTVTAGPLSVAIVGVGAFAREYVLPGIEASRHCETTVLVSPDVETVETAKSVERLAPESFHDGAAAEAYDAVYIATPNHLHRRVVQTAASMGKPILCEKPVAPTADGARAIRALIDDAGVPCLIGYRVQFKPVMRSLRDAIREGLIGTPVSAHSDVAFRVDTQETEGWRLDPDSGGGALRDIGIYPINTLQFLLDRPLEASWGDLRQDPELGGVDAHAAFALADGDDFRALCSASFAAEPTSHLRINGTEGLVAIEEPYHPSAQPVVTIVEHGTRRTVGPDPFDEYAAQVDYFAQCIFRDESPTPDAGEGVRDLERIEAIEEASAKS
ncbi:MAG: Gfo/Idh/MocA family oxidoreductase [Halobellus sp.]|uniref:Gfo/Idh/MocA family protein n=1 Tax=Halobellus sp. TaxID=1979212 RepID=UPI0035D4DE77